MSVSPARVRTRGFPALQPTEPPVRGEFEFVQKCGMHVQQDNISFLGNKTLLWGRRRPAVAIVDALRTSKLPNCHYERDVIRRQSLFHCEEFWLAETHSAISTFFFFWTSLGPQFSQTTPELVALFLRQRYDTLLSKKTRNIRKEASGLWFHLARASHNLGLRIED